MSRSLRNYLVFLVLAGLSASMALSSALLWLVLPRGFHPARRVWVDIHKWGGLALTVAVLVHVLLHRSWLIRTTKRYLRLQGSDKAARVTSQASPEFKEPSTRS